MARLRLAGLLALLPLPVLAQEPDAGCETLAGREIAEIRFEGNEVTRPSTMLREIGLRPGEALDLQSLEDSRQAVQDLGLFRSVRVRCEPDVAGLVLIFRLREKYYLIPVPRADANTDGAFAFGAQLSWHNVLGLNHTLRLRALKRDTRQAGRGSEIDYTLDYDLPAFGNSPYGAHFYANHELAAIDRPGGSFDEVSDTVEALLRYRFDRRASRGASLWGGLNYTEQHAADPAQGVDFGETLSLRLGADYRDRRFHIYSETGTLARVGVALAREGWGSDHGRRAVDGLFEHAWQVGGRAHQTAAVGMEFGHSTGGVPDGLFDYDVGGVRRLRGYAKNTQIGDSFVSSRAEFFRPLFRRWLRVGVFAEAGSAWRGPDTQVSGLLADVGIGVRIRLTWFVDAEAEFGFAFPLVDGGDGRAPHFYGGGR